MEHFQVSKEDLYDTSKNVYPFSAARSVSAAASYT